MERSPKGLSLSSKHKPQIPNLYYGSLSTEQLRRTSYVALPPVQRLHISGPSTYRYVRQDDDLWDAIHAGRLTTSRAKGAVGLTDQPTASRIRAGQYGDAESGIVRAYQHLTSTRTPPALPAAGNQNKAVQLSEAVQHNEEQRRLFQQELAADSSPSLPGLSMAKDQMCQLLCERGMSPMRLLWGTVQEASALAVVAQLYPNSLLQEVGMFDLDTSHLPLKWGFEAGDLPLLGASPDAIITHHLHISAAVMSSAKADLAQKRQDVSGAVLAAAALSKAQELLEAALGACLHGASGSGTVSNSSGNGSSNGSNGNGSSSSSSSSTDGGAANSASSSRSSSSSSSSNAHCSSRGSSSGAFRTTSMSDRNSGSTLYGARHAQGSSSQQHQHSLDPSSWSPSLQHSQATACEWLSIVLLDRHGTAGGASLGMGGAHSCSVQLSAQFTEAELDADGAVSMLYREAVEVKNHMPFFAKPWVRNPKVFLSDRGPVSSVSPAWLPQLQLHCVATGSTSVLLLSRSATRGVRLFRVQRDDEYLRSLFHFISILEVQHVAKCKPPARGMFLGLEGYEDFVAATVRIADEARCIMQTDSLPPLDGTDTRLFI